MADDEYFAGAGFKVGVMLQSDFYDPDPDAADTAPTWSATDGKKVGACSGWEFNVQVDLKKLYAMSSIKRIAVARSKARVEGKLDFYKFDPTLSSFWVMKIPDSSGVGSIADTSQLAWFMLYGSIKPAGTGDIFGAKVYNASFNGIPFGASPHEWMGWNLSFVGVTVELTNTEVTFT